MPVIDDLESKSVKELKDLLKLEGLPVKGRRAELIERLQTYLGQPKPTVAWQYSNAKKDLRKALMDPHSCLHKMSAKHKQYPLFQEFVVELKKQVAEEKKSVEVDDRAAKMHLLSFPRSELNKRGYPHWEGHAAKTLLEVDVANKLHNTTLPGQLREMREEYKEFPPKVFAKHVYAEATKQKAAGFWADKRNKKAMKSYLQNVHDRSSV
eukprot:CCRYP_010917-RA/>CCRYP_010917-RA protein AED:0.20 eAED:0.19 QI:0/0/0/1/1/1/2/0/208